jgi:hypothetical protein
MNKCAPETGDAAGAERASLGLRHAQRAFAAMLEAMSFGASRSVGEFRGAQLRSVARRTLSALSADDRAQLTDWLTLQLAASSRQLGERAFDLVARIDLRLVARVRRALPARVEALAMRGGANHIVAA